jgi:hypothetical protein
MTRDEIDALINKAATNMVSPLIPAAVKQSTAAAPALSLVPDAARPVRPVYEEYKPAEWDPTSQFKDTKGWKWSKNARAHDRFNEEQNALAAQHLQAYNAKLGAYQDELNAYNTAIERQREDAKEQRRQLENYFAAQGAIAPMGDDPSWQIRQLSTAWGNTTDAGLRNQYHQQALDLARKAGWIGAGEAPESVSLLPQVQTSMAGTPTYDRLYDEWKKQFEEQKYTDDRSDAEFDRWYKMQVLNRSGSSGGGGGGGGGSATAKKAKPPTYGEMVEGVSRMISEFSKPQSLPAPSSMGGLTPGMFSLIPKTQISITPKPEDVFNRVREQIISQAVAADLSNADINNLISLASKQLGLTDWVKINDEGSW